jgi:SAM-dependent methyltransferase
MSRKLGPRGAHRLAFPLLAGLLAAIVLWRRVGAAGREAPRWYDLVYRASYLLGFRPWGRDVPAADLVDLVQGPSPLPPGRALDLGCGTGTNSVYLARQGWEVTGVDMVRTALAMARRKAAAAGVSPRFVEGDVTRLRECGVGDGYTLLMDFGCFHTLPEDRRAAYVEGVTEVAAPGATLLLVGFTRRPKLAPLAASATAKEMRERFDGRRWELVSARPMSAEALAAAGAARAAQWFEPWSYRLRRLPS